MTDKELLQECLDAFEAIPVAHHARKMLKKIGEKITKPGTHLKP